MQRFLVLCVLSLKDDVAGLKMVSFRFSYTCCICSFVKLARSSPSSCKYMQSFLGQLWFFMKWEQYFVVPSDAFSVRPSEINGVISSLMKSRATTNEYVVDSLNCPKSVFGFEVGDIRASTWPLCSSLKRRCSCKDQRSKPNLLATDCQRIVCCG